MKLMQQLTRSELITHYTLLRRTASLGAERTEAEGLDLSSQIK
jgi:hypothetical protein